jgi:uncharacterized Ntn-hydrolase superfamily protein
MAERLLDLHVDDHPRPVAELKQPVGLLAL